MGVKGKKHHNLSSSKAWRAWFDMRRRCSDPTRKSYSRYGGRGIVVCKRWESFEMFLEDMGFPPSQGHSLDRIDTNGNYDPGNCRWATRKEQANNKSDSRLISIDGITKTVSQWSELSLVKRNTISARLDRGWEPRQAVFGNDLS